MRKGKIIIKNLIIIIIINIKVIQISQIKTPWAKIEQYSGSRYSNPNYGKNINNKPKNKNFNHKKKRIQDINYNEYYNANKSDSK